jgi:hypothetical protein
MTRKLTARKNICMPSRRNVVPTESHNNGQRASYFLRTLQTLLLSLGYGEPPLFIWTLRFLRGNTYLGHVWVVIYEKSMTECVCYICQVIEAAAPWWMFEGGMWDAVWEALVVLCHEEDDQMEHSQYWHFLSQAREGLWWYPLKVVTT